MKILLGIFCISLVIACKPTNQNITRIDCAKTIEMCQDLNTVLIDVRTPGEVAQGFVKGTDLFIDYNGQNFEAQIDALDKDKAYIVYCHSGNRSTQALNIMAKKGFNKLYELEGGILAVPVQNISK